MQEIPSKKRRSIIIGSFIILILIGILFFILSARPPQSPPLAPPLARGLVYEIDPIQTPRLKEVGLDHLHASGYLEGDFADVYLSLSSYSEFGDSVLTPKAQHDVYAPDGNFGFADDPIKLSQVNVYYHINKIHDYFSDDLNYNFQQQVKCYVRHKALHNQCSHVPLKDDIRFGVYDNDLDPALNADAIYHEYTHVIMESIFQLDDEGEAAAIREAYADYFACSLLHDPLYGEYPASSVHKMPSRYDFPRDRLVARTTPQKTALRNLKNEKRYPQDLLYEGHRDSEILSGALWDLREALGPRMADKVIFEGYKALHKLPDSFFLGGSKGKYFLSPFFASIRQSILRVDKELMGGVHQKTIQKIFDDRGIPEKPYAYYPSYQFGSHIKMGWYPRESDVFYEMRWLGVYRQGSRQYLYGHVPRDFQGLELKMYDPDNEDIPKLSSRAELKNGRDARHKIFFVAFNFPEEVAPGQYTLQFHYSLEDGSTEVSNAVMITLLRSHAR